MCTGEGECLKCNTGYTLNQFTDPVAIDVCLPDECFDCNDCGIADCQVCSSSESLCNLCYPGYVLWDD